MKLKPITLFFFVILFVCFGCEVIPESTAVVETYVQQLEPDNKATAENYEYKLEPDLTGIRGVIVDQQNNPISDVVVRAAVVVWNEDRTAGNFILDGSQSPSTISDDKGFFILMNIIPQEYVLIVGDIDVDPVVIPESDGSNKAKIFIPIINEILDVGTFHID